jgi:hypothetical protein
VLRPHEARHVFGSAPDLARRYRAAEAFDVGERLDRLGYIPGRDYLAWDQRFEVYRREDASEPRAGGPPVPRITAAASSPP